MLLRKGWARMLLGKGAWVGVVKERGRDGVLLRKGTGVEEEGGGCIE